MLWKGYPVEEAQWISTENFMKPTYLQKYIQEDEPQEENYSYEDIAIVSGGSSCEIFGGLWVFSTCTNKPTGKDLCAGHVSGGEYDGLLVG